MPSTRRATVRARSTTRPRTTIHAYVATLLKRTVKPYAEIAALTRKAFHSETSPASVRHYASKLRREKVKIKDRPVVREAAFA